MFAEEGGKEKPKQTLFEWFAAAASNWSSIVKIFSTTPYIYFLCLPQINATKTYANFGVRGMTAQVQKSFPGGGENEDGKAHVCCKRSHFSALKCNYKNYGFF